MCRIPVHRNVRIAATALAAIGTGLAAASIAAPARADHAEGAVVRHVQRVAASHLALAGELILGHAPVVTVHRVVYPPPRPRYAHPHHAKGHARCRHAAHRWAHARRDFRRGIPPHERWERGPERGRH